MKIRRMIAIFLCVCMLLPLVGCGKEDAPSPSEEQTTGTTAGTTPTDPTDPTVTDPTDPTDPADPTQPTDPSDPTEPTDPTDPTEPTDPTDPTDPVVPSNPVIPNEPDPDPAVPAPDDGYIDIGIDKLPYSEEKLYEQLFNLNNKVEINLDMSDEELSKMQQDYDRYRDMGSKSPIYRMTNLTIKITTPYSTYTYRISEVGVRMKGNTSRTSFYDRNKGGIYKYIHLKLDFQETFDDETYYGSSAKVWNDKDARKARKNRTFATLEKLELRWNKCYDSTYLKEIYAYELYRENGVMAPMASMASLDWSGIHMGIYTVVEPVDEVFISKRLPASEQGGDLYKLGWPASFTRFDSVGIEDEDKSKFYVYDLKSNKKTSQHAALKNLITKLNSGTVTKESFAQVVDAQNFVNYAAVSYFLGNPDDLRNNYNNVYLYFTASGKAMIIPYDYDRCLGVTYEYNPSGHALTTDNPFSQYREAGQGGRERQDNPLFIYSVNPGGFYVKEYAEALKKVAASNLLKPDTFTNYFSRASRMYGHLVKPSKTMENADGRDFKFDIQRTGAANSNNNMSFKDYITAKMATYNKYIGKADDYISQKPTVVAQYYIMGNFNNWQAIEEYGMTPNEDGLLTYTLTKNQSIKMKICHQASWTWFGTECLEEGSDLVYTSEGRNNFRLAAGTYYITFNPETQVISIKKLK